MNVLWVEVFEADKQDQTTDLASVETLLFAHLGQVLLLLGDNTLKVMADKTYIV